MKKLIVQHSISMKHALNGLVWAFSTQPNFRIHTFISVFVLIMAFTLHVSRIEMGILLFAIILGFTGELINTAIEAVTDLVTTEWRKEAKIAKDVAAGMMLFIAIGSSIVAVFIFAPYLLPLISL